MTNFLKSVGSALNKAVTAIPKATKNLWDSTKKQVGSKTISKEIKGIGSKASYSEFVKGATTATPRATSFTQAMYKTGLKPNGFKNITTQAKYTKTTAAVGYGLSVLPKAMGKLGYGIGKTMVNHPGTAITLGLGLGGAMSSGRYALERVNNRTMQSDRGRNGMQANHLGTDGLTLALSKARHRG